MCSFLLKSISLNRLSLFGSTVIASITANVQTIDGSGTIEPNDIRKGIFSKVTDVIINGTIEKIETESFILHTSLQNVDIQGTIKVIGHSVFPRSLLSINFGNYITSIGVQAFTFTKLTQIHLPPTTSIIYDQCFWTCSSLAQVVFDDIENSVLKTISNLAFRDCPIISLVLPKSVVTIGSGCFSKTLTETIILGPNVTSFYGAFSGSSVKTIEIDPLNSIFSKSGSLIYQKNPLTLYAVEDWRLTSATADPQTVKIGKYAFFSTQISQIKFVDTITCFEEHAFDGCSQLLSIALPPNLTEIKDFCFFGSGLRTIHITSLVTTIGSSVFTSCKDLTAVTVEEGNQNFKADDQGMLYNRAQTNIIFIPTNCNAKITLPTTVNKLAQGQFRGCNFSYLILNEGIPGLPFTCIYQCPNLLEIRVPRSVTAMAEAAIGSCANLEKIIFEDNSECVSTALSMYYNAQLHTVDFGKNPKLRGLSTLTGCSKLVNIQIPGTVNSIAPNCFEGCVLLGSLNLSSPNELTIGQNAFKGCSSLKVLRIDIPQVTDGAIASCTGLTTVVISKRVTRIGANGFANCGNLREITFENIDESSLERIESLGFAECLSLVNITLPDSIQAVSASSFSYSSKLMNINIRSGAGAVYRSVEGVVYRETGVSQTLVACPNGRESLRVIGETRILGENSFTGCGLLKNIYFNTEIVEISKYCFSGCTSLSVLNIPSGTQRVGTKAFENCISLNLIYFCSDNPIPFADESPFLPTTKIIVRDTYSENFFLNHPVIKSTSIDRGDCPIMPTNNFSRKLRLKKAPFIGKMFSLLFMKLIIRI